MTSFDPTELAHRYAREETEELIRIAFVRSSEYVAEAVAVAREELRRRGVEGGSDDRITVVREEEAERQKVADEPLDLGVKIVCFLLPSAVGAICALSHSNQGKTRAAADAWTCTGLGFLVRTALLIGFIVAN